MLKVELHSHTSDDPHDSIPHSATDLIDRAAALGYDALAITLHDRQLDLRRLRPYAEDRGLVLIPGIERMGGPPVVWGGDPSAKRVFPSTPTTLMSSGTRRPASRRDE